MDALPHFFTSFELASLVSEEDVTKYLEELIQKEQFNDAVTVISAFDGKKALATPLIHAMTSNKHASKAADYLKKFKLDPNDFPDLKVRLDKKAIRHFLN